MQFHNFPATRLLVQTIDVLGDDSFKFAHFFKICQGSVGRIWLRIFKDHFIPVKTIKFLRILYKKAMAENRLRRKIIFLVIQSVYTAKIWNMALCGDAGASKKYDISTFIDPLF